VKDGYRLIDWPYVCDQSPLIQAAHEEASDDAEYSVDFYEFINRAGGLQKMAEQWWMEQPWERRIELLRDKKRDLLAHITAIEQEIVSELEGGVE